MDIKSVSLGLIGTTVLAGVISGCYESKYVDKAKADAVKYLSVDDLLKAEIFAKQQINHEQYNAEEITYWDSLIIEAKSKEAYRKGYQLVSDSLKDIHHRKEKFKVHLDTICSDHVVEDVKKEYAKYSNSENFFKAKNNAPTDGLIIFKNPLVGTIHYWNLITMNGKQKEAYQKGMADARRELIKK